MIKVFEKFLNDAKVSEKEIYNDEIRFDNIFAEEYKRIDENDPYGEETWDDVLENYNESKGITVRQLWRKCNEEGVHSVKNEIKNKIIEFKTTFKNVGEYVGEVNGFLPVYSRIEGPMILFSTPEHGVLKVDKKYPVIIKNNDV